MKRSVQNILKGRAVLIVDDEADSLMVCRVLLEMYGAIVVTANSGKQALAKVETNDFDLIVSDLSMPEMDGWQLLKYLRQDDKLKDIPVIALTAHAMSGDRTKAFNAGFDNYITKPLIPETFHKELVKIFTETPAIATRLHSLAKKRSQDTTIKNT